MSELNIDDELVHDYLAECREHLATIETDLLAIEQQGAAIDEQLVNRVFRAAHSIKGAPVFSIWPRSASWRTKPRMYSI